VVHRVSIINLDIDELSRNSNLSEKDLTRVRWHGDCDREAIPRWHAVVYLTLLLNFPSMMPGQGSNKESDRTQVVSDVWKDHTVLHKLQ